MVDTPRESVPRVTVVIPALNCVEDVQGCVEALRAQTYPASRYDILVVDNGSTDGTAQRVESLGVSCLRRAERGRSRALNTGLEQSDGEIICTTDMSCRPAPEWIAEVVRSFADPEVGCVAGEIELLKTDDNLALAYQERSNYMSPMNARFRDQPPYLPYADGANASFRREVFDAIGPFAESFIKAADVEICYRMFFLTDFKLAFNPRAVVREPGESDLRTLMKQRYRIGIGNMLLRARFPDLFADGQRKSPKEIYWAACDQGGRLLKTLGLGIRSVWQKQARTQFADMVLVGAMSAIQVLGRRQGKRYLTRAERAPEPIRADSIHGYVSGEWMSSSRIVEN